jgi:hypothetical protein
VMAKPTKPLGRHGGARKGSGRKCLFPGKGDPHVGQKISVQLTRVAVLAAKQKAEILTGRKPGIAAADDVKVVTFSDAIEYCIRRATNTPLED